MAATIDEALETLPRTGPDVVGGHSNHGPKVTEALFAQGPPRLGDPWEGGDGPAIAWTGDSLGRPLLASTAPEGCRLVSAAPAVVGGSPRGAPACHASRPQPLLGSSARSMPAPARRGSP